MPSLHLGIYRKYNFPTPFFGSALKKKTRRRPWTSWKLTHLLNMNARGWEVAPSQTHRKRKVLVYFTSGDENGVYGQGKLSWGKTVKVIKIKVNWNFWDCEENLNFNSKKLNYYSFLDCFFSNLKKCCTSFSSKFLKNSRWNFSTVNLTFLLPKRDGCEFFLLLNFSTGSLIERTHTQILGTNATAITQLEVDDKSCENVGKVVVMNIKILC